MAPCIIDHLEAVNIDIESGSIEAALSGMDDRLFDAVIEKFTVGKACEPIMQRSKKLVVALFIEFIFPDEELSALPFHDVSGNAANDVCRQNEKQMVKDDMWRVSEMDR
jgi:hypothetical protein